MALCAVPNREALVFYLGRASTRLKTHSKLYYKHRKLRRKKAYDLLTPSEIPPKKDFLQRLRLELLAEILKFSSSITVLAVARTCKWLCETLNHKEQEFIWKAPRTIFDVGNCIVCLIPVPNIIEAQTLNVPKLGKIVAALGDNTHVSSTSRIESAPITNVVANYCGRYLPGHAKRHKALFEAFAQKNPSGLDGKIGLELGWVATEPVTKDGLSIRSDIYRYTEQLMSNTPSGKRKRALREYACRHCEFSLTNTSRAPRLFTADGLQSHLKASHGIYPLRNEDFCHVPKLSSHNLERTQQSEETAIVSCQPRSDVAVVGRARTSSNDPKLWTADQLV
ncbi:hypothetical protein M407DRAFT_27055 [Tulasnella calospora MUT 4182]|uniref:F-box domain-containing protein n=1 Tax=Tulasnella calospora MUT 4182 TaxID=1051891 RepID=A0A0C3KQ04_9AGAM|nr:hypothetical protein M407DRAFT_27055 [Tulasnella calospora MUT 4182]